MWTRIDNEVVIGDHNYHLREHHDWLGADGLVRTRGAVPRDPDWTPDVAPRTAIDMPLIDQSEWTSRAADLEQSKSRLSDIRMRADGGQPFRSLDQGQVGYCWAHSSTHAVTYLRAVANLPYVPLSAYSVAATIKNGRDEGGWGALSLDFITAKGVMAQSVWPQGDRNYRHYDTSDNWANAALHKVTEGWVDTSAQQYDRSMTFAQVVTCLLSRVPVVVDYNWWSHSVCAIDVVSGSSMRDRVRGAGGKLLQLADFDRAMGMNDPVTAGVSIRIQNSWSDSWSDRGMGVLSGSKAVPDGAVAPRVAIASES